MINEPTTAHEQVRALAAAVRDGELNPEQWECLVTLLHTLNTAVRLAPQAQEIYPDNDASALGYMSAMWEAVAASYTQLAATVHPGGEEHAA
jgi:hypothetical protein